LIVLKISLRKRVGGSSSQITVHIPKQRRSAQLYKDGESSQELSSPLPTTSLPEAQPELPILMQSHCLEPHLLLQQMHGHFGSQMPGRLSQG
jgi:hypothetical protein